MLGDIAMFGDGDYVSSAKAVTGTRVFRFERSQLLPALASHPAVCLRWLVAGLRQLEGTQRRVIRLMHKTVLSQVADLLAEEGRDEERCCLVAGDDCGTPRSQSPVGQ